MLPLQVSHHISLLGPELIQLRLRPKHVELTCRNKTCTVLHQVGVSFDLYYDARKHKIKIYFIQFECPLLCPPQILIPSDITFPFEINVWSHTIVRLLVSYVFHLNLTDNVSRDMNTGPTPKSVSVHLPHTIVGNIYSGNCFWTISNTRFKITLNTLRVRDRIDSHSQVKE